MPLLYPLPYPDLGQDLPLGYPTTLRPESMVYLIIRIVSALTAVRNVGELIWCCTMITWTAIRGDAGPWSSAMGTGVFTCVVRHCRCIDWIAVHFATSG
jgi:hypothetical protein